MTTLPASTRQALRAITLLGPVLLLAPLAHAGRPLQTEDAGILEPRDCEVEGATQRLRLPGAARSTENSLQLACGIGASTQLAIAASSDSSAGTSDKGLRLGGKTEIWSAGKDGAALTLAWGASGLKPAGASWQRGSAEARAVASVPGAGLTWHLNLGHERDLQAKSSTTVWGVAAEHPGTGTVAPMAELFGDDRGAAWWNFGVRWTLREDRAFLDVSYGRQMSRGQPQLLTAGFKFVF